VSAAAGDGGDAVAEGQGAGGAAAACSGCSESSSGGVGRVVCAGNNKIRSKVKGQGERMAHAIESSKEDEGRSRGGLMIFVWLDCEYRHAKKRTLRKEREGNLGDLAGRSLSAKQRCR